MFLFNLVKTIVLNILFLVFQFFLLENLNCVNFTFKHTAFYMRKCHSVKFQCGDCSAVSNIKRFEMRDEMMMR